MRAHPWLIATITMVMALILYYSRFNEFREWEEEHIRETGKTYKESGVE